MLERKYEPQGRKSARYGAAMAPLLSPDVATRRARAALEYAPYERDEVQRRAAEIEPRLTPATFNRIVSRSDTRGFNNSDELEAFAEACGVPAWFLEMGFAQEQEETRLENIESEVAANRAEIGLLATRLEEMQQMLARRSGSGASETQNQTEQ